MDKKNVPFYFKAIKGEDGTQKFFGIASSNALDRDREILIPKGMDSNNFLKNPVMLLSHNYYGLPIGKVGDLQVDDAEVKFEFDFAETDDAKEVKSLYEGGYMHAFSVSFIPKAYFRVEEDTPNIVELSLPNGASQKIDLSSYKVRPRGIITDWELLEVSAVSVPANPEAIIQRSFESAVARVQDPARKTLFRSQVGDTVAGLIDQVNAVLEGLEHPDIKGAVPIHSIPIVEQAWDASAAKSNLAGFASEDGSGSKETLDWGSYSRGFGWFDDASLDKFTGYKFCHHDIADGKLVTVWEGVVQAMKTLLKSESQNDRETVYAHLAKHYRDYEQEPPELKAYTDEELDKAFQPVEDDGADDGADDGKDPGTKAMDYSEMKSLFEDRLNELEETVICRIGVLSGMVLEAIESAENLKGNSGDAGDSAADDGLEDKDIEETFGQLTDLFSELDKSCN